MTPGCRGPAEAALECRRPRPSRRWRGATREVPMGGCRVSLACLLLAGPSLAASGPQAATPAPCDLLFAGGRVVDGTGAPWFRADVCVRGGRVAAVGELGAAPAKRRIDASRLVVDHGFIDMMGQSA